MGVVRTGMSVKERWLAAVRLEPVDRLLFWPKLNASYPRAQAAPFTTMAIGEIHDWIGSDKHVWLPGCVKEIRSQTSAETFEKDGVRKTLFRTPHGETELVCHFDVPSQSWHPTRFPVQDLDDVGLMTEVFDDVRVELDEEGLRASQDEVARIGHDALTATTIGESPLMHWVEWLAGIANAHCFLCEHRGEVETLFEAMHRVLREKAELLTAYSPADVLYLSENTSTTLISPHQYRRYCCRHIRDYATVVREGGRVLILHMCGHLKGLLRDLDRLPVCGFEAFTSPTLGDTTLLDGRKACPGKCLIGGTNAMLWTKSADTIIGQIEKDLDDLPHHRGLAITSAGVMPPMCAPETIRTVCHWVKSYPVRI